MTRLHSSPSYILPQHGGNEEQNHEAGGHDAVGDDVSVDLVHGLHVLDGEHVAVILVMQGDVHLLLTVFT